MRNPSAVHLALAALCLGGPAFMAAGDSPATTSQGKPAKESFGFSGMEMYKLDWDTHNLRLADVTGNGLTDIVVVNNARGAGRVPPATPEIRRRLERRSAETGGRGAERYPQRRALRQPALSDRETRLQPGARRPHRQWPHGHGVLRRPSRARRGLTRTRTGNGGLSGRSTSPTAPRNRTRWRSATAP